MKCFNPVPLTVSVKKDKHLQSLYNMKYYEKEHLYRNDRITYKELESNEKIINILAPCGKCFACRQNRLREWQIRLVHEYCRNFADKQIYFITLTYNNENLKDKSLDYKDCQLFIKRFRKHYKGQKIKYMAVGEYGFQSFRKHFHLIIFGMDKVVHNEIHKLWNKGFVHIKKCDVGMVGYLLKYSFKQHFINKKDYLKLGLTPPMFRVSQGFGKDFFLDNYKDIITRKYFEYNGKKYSIPRYYRNMLYMYYLKDGHEIIEEMQSLTKQYILNTLEECNKNFGFDYLDFKSLDELFLFKKLANEYLTNLNNKLYDKFKKNFKEKI